MTRRFPLVGDENKYAFKINGKQWQGGEVNYTVWGYMADHYGLSWSATEALVDDYKFWFRGEPLGSQVIENCLYWVRAGYYGTLP